MAIFDSQKYTNKGNVLAKHAILLEGGTEKTSTLFAPLRLIYNIYYTLVVQINDTFFGYPPLPTEIACFIKTFHLFVYFGESKIAIKPFQLLVFRLFSDSVKRFNNYPHKPHK